MKTEYEMQDRIDELERALSWLHDCTFRYYHGNPEERKRYAKDEERSLDRAWETIHVVNKL